MADGPISTAFHNQSTNSTAPPHLQTVLRLHRAACGYNVEPMSATPCPLCDDTGWKAVGEGRERRVVRCDCRPRTRADRLLQAARIPRRYQHCELAEFDAKYPGAHASLAEAKLWAERFVANYPVEDKGLLLVGPLGVGKTHLAAGIMKELILQKGIQCLF